MDLRRRCTRHQPDDGLEHGSGRALDLQALLLPTGVFPAAQALPRPYSHPSPSWSSSLHSDRVPRMLALGTSGEVRRPLPISGPDHSQQ